MSRVLALLLVLTSTAAAEPDTLEARQRDVGLSGPKNEVNAHAFAQAGGGSLDRQSTADLAGGAEVLAPGRTCSFFRAGAQGQLRLEDGWHASAGQWGSVCAPLHSTVIEVGHELDWDVRPSLLAPLGLRPGLNRRETLELGWVPLRMLIDDLMAPEPAARPAEGAVQGARDGELRVLEMNTEMTWLWSQHGESALHAVPELTMLEYRRDGDTPWADARDLKVKLFRADGQFAHRATMVGFSILEIENLEVGPFFAGAGIGFASAGAGAKVTDTDREVQVNAARGFVSLETGGANAHAYVRAASDPTLAPDGYVVIDHRLSTGGVIDLGATHIAVDGTLAADDVHVPPNASVRATTGGGALSLVRDLGKHLRASVQVEVARSFYARSSDTAEMQDFAPRWGTRALGVLQAFAGR